MHWIQALFFIFPLLLLKIAIKHNKHKKKKNLKALKIDINKLILLKIGFRKKKFERL